MIELTRKFNCWSLQCIVFENPLRFLQHTAQKEMNALALHRMVFARRCVVEILPTYLPVLPPSVAVSE